MTTYTSYKLVNEIVSGNRHALYQLDNNLLSFGGTSGFWGGIKGINLRRIGEFDEILGLSAFNILLHEIREGYYQCARIITDKEIASPRDAYPSSHWQALLDQSKDLGFEFMCSGTVQYNPPKRYTEDGALLAVAYKKLKNNKYLKITYEIKMENGEFKRNKEGKIEYEKTTKEISADQYKKEKKEQREKIKQLG